MKTQGKAGSGIISDKELHRLERIVALGIRLRQLRLAKEDYEAMHTSRLAAIDQDIQKSAVELATITEGQGL